MIVAGGKTKKPWLIMAMVVVLGAGFGAFARPWEEKPLSVRTEVLRAGPVSQVLAVNGRIAARDAVTLRAAVSAQAISIKADEGQKVKAGEVLLELDTAIIEAQREQARAALQAQQALEAQAQAAVTRNRALGANSARATLEDAEFALATARKETARLDAALLQIERQRAEYQIRAPFDGVILAREVDPGQLVDPQSDLFLLADTSALLIETEIDEIYSAAIREGQSVRLKPIGQDGIETGHVIFAAPRVDSTTGGRKIKIAPDHPLDLPIGLSVTANIVTTEIAAALTLPRSAIQTEDGKTQVMIADQNRARARNLRVIDWPADRLIVTEGLQEGEKVILDPVAPDQLIRER